MGRLEPYDHEQRIRLLDDALLRMRPYHDRWQLERQLFESGTVEDWASRADVASSEVGTLLRDTWGSSPEVVNFTLSHINLMKQSISSRAATHLCEPLNGGPEADDAATIAEHIIRYYYRRTGATDILSDCTLDLLISGPALCKVGWDYVEGTIARDPLDIHAETTAALHAAADVAEANGEQLNVHPNDLKGHVQLTEKVVDVDEPFVSYVSPFDFFVDSNARNLGECRWVCERMRVPVDELKARDDLDSSVEIIPDNEWHTNRHVTAPNRGAIVHDSFDTATVFEFYDLRPGVRKMAIFQLGATAPLYEGDIPYSHRFSPYLFQTNYRTPEDFWGWGEVKNIAPLQAALNDMVRESIANARRSGNKYFIDADMATDDVLDDLQSDIPDLAIKVRRSDPSMSMNDYIKAVPREPLSQDVYSVGGQMRDYMAQVLGINDFQAGGVGSDRMSATAAAVVDGVATLRAQDKIAAVERLASMIGQRLLELAQELMSPDTAMRIAGPRGSLQVRVTPEFIRGEFSVTVEGGSTQAINPASRQKRAMDRLNTILPVFQQLGYDPEPLLRSIMRDLDLDPDQFLKRPPAPPAPPAAPPAAPGAPADMPPAAAGPEAPQDLPAPTPDDLGPQADMGLPADLQLQGRADAQ